MDLDSIKDFFIYHVEKMILAVVVGVSGFLIYAGLGKEHITSSQKPAALATDAQQVKTAVDEDHTELILKERVSDFDVKKALVIRRDPVVGSNYPIKKTWEVVSTDSGIKRRDPTISAPIAVRAQGVLASIAYRSETGKYPLLDLEPADPVEVIEKKELPKRRQRRPRRGAMMDDMGGDMGMGMEDMDMMSSDMGMDMGMGMGMDMGMGMGATAGATSPIRKFALKGDFGMRPVATQNIKTRKDQPPVPGTGYFIAGTAVVPYKEIHDSYKMALSTATGFNPMTRDRPMFRGFEVQRADVTDKPADQLVEADWVKRDGNLETRYDAVLLWSGFAPELVSSEYRVDTYLTMWIPPVLLDDYSTFALHPLIPMKTSAQLAIEAQKRALENIDANVEKEDLIFDDPANPMARGGGGMDMMDEMDMMDDMDMGGMGGMDMGGGSMMMMEANPVDYKLIRFYDFVNGRDQDSPKQGRKYVYRVRVCVNDPNFPQTPELQPKGNSLASDVYDRYLLLVKDAEATKKRDYKRWSEWSDPGESVSLPSLSSFYAGPITADAPKPANTKLGSYESDPPKAKVLMSHFDQALRAKVGVLLEVTEGFVFGVQPEVADVVDPITLEVKKVEKPLIASGATVVDIDGGAPMTIQEGDDMREPGMMLIFDPDGGLKVHDEVNDQELYRIKSFATERNE